MKPLAGKIGMTALLALATSAHASDETAPGAPASATPDHLTAAVAHADRPDADRERDADRRPAQVLAFFGIEPGMKVAEMMSGRGYYAELLGHAVGPGGRVYAQNNRFVLERFAEEDISRRLAKPSLAQVQRLDQELDAPGLPEGELDAVLMILFYHDTYWMEADRAAMNRAILASLRPGGVYGIVDHHAEAGSGARDVKTLHRVDIETVKGEILDAGFELDGDSDLLRQASDPRTGNVFEEELRGKTDRFILKFRKPLATAETPPS